MSDDPAELDDRPLSAATDPHGTATAGDLPDNWHGVDPETLRNRPELWSSDAEREHNARVFGETYRERAGLVHGQRRGDPCLILCQQPSPERVNRCPSCYGRAIPMDLYQAKLEALPRRAERIGRWAGEWAAAFWEALTMPFRHSAEHQRALIVDVLQDAMAAGLSAEIDGLADILTVLEGMEGELRAIRDAAEAKADA